MRIFRRIIEGIPKKKKSLQEFLDRPLSKRIRIGIPGWFFLGVIDENPLELYEHPLGSLWKKSLEELWKEHRELWRNPLINFRKNCWRDCRTKFRNSRRNRGSSPWKILCENSHGTLPFTLRDDLKLNVDIIIFLFFSGNSIPLQKTWRSWKKSRYRTYFIRIVTSKFQLNVPLYTVMYTVLGLLLDQNIVCTA